MSKRDLTLVWEVNKEAESYSLYWSNAPITNWEEATVIADNIDEHFFVHTGVDSTADNYYLATGNIGAVKHPSNVVVRNKDIPECVPTDTKNYNTVTNPELIASTNTAFIVFSLKQQGSNNSYVFGTEVPASYLNTYSNVYNWIAYAMTISLERQIDYMSVTNKQQLVLDIMSKINVIPYKQLSGLSKNSSATVINQLNDNYLTDIPLKAVGYKENPITLIISKPTPEQHRTLLAIQLGFTDGVIDDYTYQYYANYYKSINVVDLFNNGNDIELFGCGEILFETKELDYSPRINYLDVYESNNSTYVGVSADVQPDYYNIYHSLQPFDSTSLPSPLETNIYKGTNGYQHYNVNMFVDNYYMIEAVKDGKSYFSNLGKSDAIGIEAVTDTLSVDYWAVLHLDTSTMPNMKVLINDEEMPHEVLFGGFDSIKNYLISKNLQSQPNSNWFEYGNAYSTSSTFPDIINYTDKDVNIKILNTGKYTNKVYSVSSKEFNGYKPYINLTIKPNTTKCVEVLFSPPPSETQVNADIPNGILDINDPNFDYWYAGSKYLRYVRLGLHDIRGGGFSHNEVCIEGQWHSFNGDNSFKIGFLPIYSNARHVKMRKIKNGYVDYSNKVNSLEVHNADEILDWGDIDYSVYSKIPDINGSPIVYMNPNAQDMEGMFYYEGEIRKYYVPTRSIFIRNRYSVSGAVGIKKLPNNAPITDSFAGVLTYLNPDVSHNYLNNWDTSNVIDMHKGISYHIQADVSNWNISNLSKRGNYINDIITISPYPNVTWKLSGTEKWSWSDTMVEMNRMFPNGSALLSKYSVAYNPELMSHPIYRVADIPTARDNNGLYAVSVAHITEETSTHFRTVGVNENFMNVVFSKMSQDMRLKDPLYKDTVDVINWAVSLGWISKY